MNKLPVPVLKGCPCVGTCLCSLCVLSGFGGRAGSDVSTGHVFPQDVLAAITLVGGGAGDGGVGPEPGMSQVFYAQWLSLPYLGQGKSPRCRSRSPEGQV